MTVYETLDLFLMMIAAGIILGIVLTLFFSWSGFNKN